MKNELLHLWHQYCSVASSHVKQRLQVMRNHVLEQTSLMLSSILSGRISLTGTNQKPQAVQFNINRALLHTEPLKLSVTSVVQYAIPPHTFYGTLLPLR
jgi:hypothetical protein